MWRRVDRSVSRKSRRGSSTLEFAFTGVPLLFIWLSTVQIALGMWHYSTMQYAVKAAATYVAEHGSNCGSPNTCSITITTLATVLKNNLIGIPASSMQMTFTSISSSDHKTAVGTAITCLLTNTTTPASGCDENSTAWPPSTNNTPGAEFEILGAFQWSPAIGIVSPGAGKSMTFGSFWLPAYTHQVILF